MRPRAKMRLKCQNSIRHACDVVKVERQRHIRATHTTPCNASAISVAIFFFFVLASKEWSNDRKRQTPFTNLVAEYVIAATESQRGHGKKERQRKHGTSTSKDYYYNYLGSQDTTMWSQSILSMRFGVVHCLPARRTWCIKKLSVSSYRKRK